MMQHELRVEYRISDLFAGVDVESRAAELRQEIAQVPDAQTRLISYLKLAKLGDHEESLPLALTELQAARDFDKMDREEQERYRDLAHNKLFRVHCLKVVIDLAVEQGMQELAREALRDYEPKRQPTLSAEAEAFRRGLPHQEADRRNGKQPVRSSKARR